MNEKHQSFATRVALTAVSLVVLSCAFVVGAGAATAPSLSKKDLKTLLATAKTPTDHQRLAAYYRDKAQRLNAKARELSAQADNLATQPGAIDGKRRVSLQIAGSHYSYLAKQYAQEAEKSEALAEQQEELSQTNQANPAQK